MLSVDAQTLAVLLNKTSRGRFDFDKANQIQQTAKNSFGIVLASSSFSLIIRQYLEQLKSLKSSIKIFDEEIACLLDNFDTHLETITGVGKTLAAVIFSEIVGDIKTFAVLLPRDFLSRQKCFGRKNFWSGRSRLAGLLDAGKRLDIGQWRLWARGSTGLTKKITRSPQRPPNST